MYSDDHVFSDLHNISVREVDEHLANCSDPKEVLDSAVSFLIIEGIYDLEKIRAIILEACTLDRHKRSPLLMAVQSSPARILRDFAGLENNLLLLNYVTIEEVRETFDKAIYRLMDDYDGLLEASDGDENDRLLVFLRKQAAIRGCLFDDTRALITS